MRMSFNKSSTVSYVNRYASKNDSTVGHKRHQVADRATLPGMCETTWRNMAKRFEILQAG